MFSSCELSALAVFCGEFSFFFFAPFTYLELFYLRYFSYAVFLSACLHLRCRNVFRHMRFSQWIHFMLQLVEGFVFLPFLLSLRWSPVTNC